MELVSFDGGVRGMEEVERPDRYRQIEAVDPRRKRIVRGGGYSYAAAGFGGGALVQDARAFDRVLAFDRDTGVLECEGGATLGRVYEVARAAGYYLPVQPGYPRITVAGCVAADVHGKNQYRDGNFRRVVRRITLFHPRRGAIALASGTGLFELTCGGLGLTGHILSVELQLARLPGRRVRVERVPIPRFEDTAAVLAERAPKADFVYTWHDFTARGEAFGRGYLYAGGFVPGSEGASDERFLPIDSKTRGRWPAPLLNGATLGPFNRAYAALQGFQGPAREIDLFSFLFPVATRVVYFELFGRRGFHEHQVIVPTDAFPAFARALRRFVEEQRAPVTLASCKLFRGTPSHVRFDGDGVCVALDFPRGDAGARLAGFLHGLARDTQARPNIVKDSGLPRELAAACHPGYEAFRDALARHDPERLYVSEVSERLGL